MELLSNALEQMKDLYPMLHPKVLVLPETHFPDALKREALNVAIGFHAPDVKDSLHYKELCRPHFACLFRDTLPLSQKNQVTADDLNDYAYLCMIRRVSPTIYNGQGNMQKTRNRPSYIT